MLYNILIFYCLNSLFMVLVRKLSYPRNLKFFKSKFEYKKKNKIN